MISIVLPYLSTSPCVDICKKFLSQNTVSEYELIEIVDETDVYFAYNEGVRRAKFETVALINDDMFVAPGWDLPFIKFCKPKTVVTGYLVECGRISVNHVNYDYDCGHTPTSFDYPKFASFVEDKLKEVPEVVEDRQGWFMPVAFYKPTFIQYPNQPKYPHPNDIELFHKILPTLGFKFVQVNSFAYHLQNFTATYSK